MSYDIKFKQRAVEYQREGHTYKETCKVFKISETTLTRWINKEKEGKLGEVALGRDGRAGAGSPHRPVR